jgi:hypothetical protein
MIMRTLELSARAMTKRLRRSVEDLEAFWNGALEERIVCRQTSNERRSTRCAPTPLMGAMMISVVSTLRSTGKKRKLLIGPPVDHASVFPLIVFRTGHPSASSSEIGRPVATGLRKPLDVENVARNSATPQRGR